MSKLNWGKKTCTLLLMCATTALGLPAQTYSVLHTFAGPDGRASYAGLVRDPSGNLYSTTSYGGAFDSGVVFRLNSTGKLVWVYSFTGGADGGNPDADLVADGAGNLYGTTGSGGDTSCRCGVVFKVNKTGTETVLYSFVGSPTDGANPIAGLALDPAGNLYGTTTGGGTSGAGVVFKLDTTG